MLDKMLVQHVKINSLNCWKPHIYGQSASKYLDNTNSLKNGYNTSIGGESIRAVMQDEDCKQRMINSLQEYYKTHENPFKGKKHSKETLERIQNTRKYNVAKINPQNDEIIEIYKSLLSAAKSCGVKTPDIIKKVCDKYISPTGLKYEIAYGFKWKFVLKDKGSTTTERASNVLTNDETK